jgi:multiple sugar transport system substrate-binding protein
MTLRGMTWDHPRGYRPLRDFGHGVTWDVQPLADFEARPLRELAGPYDLLVIDHPGLGDALADHALSPLDELFTPAELARWKAASAGPTWMSYTLDGRPWALPIDAAAQVSFYRPGALDHVPARWAEVPEAVRAVPSALCLGGPHALLMLLACCDGEHSDDLLPVERAVVALTLLRGLWRSVDRDVSLGNPIAVHEAMAAGAVAYCPLAYGYRTYPLGFADAPSWHGRHPASVLGGTGLAVSALTRDRPAVRAWIRAFLDPQVQAEFVPAHDGQPAAKAVWDDATTGYFAATRRSLAHALIRPRHRGWITVQDSASEVVRDCVIGAGAPEVAVAEINRQYADSMRLAHDHR